MKLVRLTERDLGMVAVNPRYVVAVFDGDPVTVWTISAKEPFRVTEPFDSVCFLLADEVTG